MYDQISKNVIPAKAGILDFQEFKTPAFAGVTNPNLDNYDKK